MNVFTHSPKQCGKQMKITKNYSHRTTDCFDDRLPFRRQMPINLEGKG